MEQFPANSKMPRVTPQDPQTPEPAEKEKRVEKAVVEGTVVRKKQSLGKRFANNFLSGEAPKSVFGYVAMQVLLPAARDMLFDAGREALQRVLYPSGGNSDTRRSGYRSSGTVTAYNRYAQPATVRAERTTVSHQARTAQSYDELIFPSRMDAEHVIDEMLILLEKYQSVSVGDFFDLANITPEYTDRKYGWKDLRGVVPIPRDGGFILTLPRPELLK